MRTSIVVRAFLIGLVVLTGGLGGVARGADDSLRDEAVAAMRRAGAFFANDVATEGGYLWQYSEDLSLREGEGVANDKTIWVQPPGTPRVGMAFLEAWRATKDRFYLDAARAAANALVRGQLRSGGWAYQIYFDPAERKSIAYRVDPPAAGQHNYTNLDDDTTQAAVRFLANVDAALEFSDAAIHEAVTYALDSVLKAQYPNGGWAQRYKQFADPALFPVRQAAYPPTWSRVFPELDYRHYYTINDNATPDVIRTLLEAADIYANARYRAAALKGGDFLLLAQMPEPQPAWAQQYNAEMYPAWARRFEPPAVCSHESFGVMRMLMELYRLTHDEKWLEPLPRAIAYFRRSQLPGGGQARFYELHTNRPLYFTRAYELTYDDSDMPTHYAFKQSIDIEQIAAEYERLRSGEFNGSPPTSQPAADALAARVRSLVTSLDDRGRWVENGRLLYHKRPDVTHVIRCRTFAKNLHTLCEFIAATDDQR